MLNLTLGEPAVLGTYIKSCFGNCGLWYIKIDFCRTLLINLRIRSNETKKLGVDWHVCELQLNFREIVAAVVSWDLFYCKNGFTFLISVATADWISTFSVFGMEKLPWRSFALEGWFHFTERGVCKFTRIQEILKTLSQWFKSAANDLAFFTWKSPSYFARNGVECFNRKPETSVCSRERGRR